MKKLVKVLFGIAILAGGGALGYYKLYLRPFSEISLPRLENPEPVALARCAKPKCVTAYLAPWCGWCKKATQPVLGFRDYVRPHDVEVRVVIGKSEIEEARKYAETFGGDTFLDPKGRLAEIKAVPFFIVSDREGNVLKKVRGISVLGKPNLGEDMYKEFAGILELF